MEHFKNGRNAYSFLVSIPALLIVLSFASCSLLDHDSSSNGNKTALSVLTYADNSASTFTKEKAIWDQFQTNNPDIALSVSYLYEDAYHTQVQADISSGNIPDLTYAWPSSSNVNLFKGGYVKDLTSCLGSDYLSSFSPLALGATQQSGGHLYELPQSSTEISVLYVNKKLLADHGLAIPTTMAEMVAVAVKLKALGKKTILLPDADQWPAQSCLFSTIVGRYLGNNFLDGINNGTKNFTDSGFIAALDYYRSLFDDGVIAASDMDMPYSDGPASFAKDDAAFFLDGDWRVGAFCGSSTDAAYISSSDQENNYTFMALPAMPNEINTGAMPSVQGCGYSLKVSSDANIETAALKLFKYIYSAEVQQKRLEMGSYFPSRLDVNTSSTAPFVQKMIALKNTLTEPCYVLDGVLSSIIITAIQSDLLALGKGSMTTAQAATDIQTALIAWRASR
jgi:raffinose/stachyose/melibiose transport system substrate-binding protein